MLHPTVCQIIDVRQSEKASEKAENGQTFPVAGMDKAGTRPDQGPGNLFCLHG
jgi:hypothetical protein